MAATTVATLGADNARRQRAALAALNAFGRRTGRVRTDELDEEPCLMEVATDLVSLILGLAAVRGLPLRELVACAAMSAAYDLTEDEGEPERWAAASDMLSQISDDVA